MGDVQNSEVLIGWASGGTQARFTAPGAEVASSYDQVSVPDFRLMGTSAPVVANGPVDGGISLSYRTPCGSGTFDPVIGPTPLPPLTFGVAEYKALVFEGANCGEKGGFVTPCKLFSLRGNGSTLVSTQAVDYLEPRLDRVGNTGTAYFETGTTALSNLSLPTHYAPSERPAYAMGGGTFAVRTTTGFSYAYLHRSPVTISANVVRSFEVPDGVGFYTSGVPGATDCSSGCVLETLKTMFDADPVRKVVLNSVTGNEQLVYGRLGYAFLSSRTWPGCPDGPCTVVEISEPSGGMQTLTRAALIDWPANGPAVKPAAFIRVNTDGGVGLASSLR